MKKPLLTLLLLCASPSLQADNVWLATLETDSLRALQLSIRSFAQTAALPGSIEEQNNVLKPLFSLPSLDYINESDTLRIFWIADSTRPIGGDGNPAQVSVLPLKRDTKALDLYLFNTYKSKRTLQGVTTYSVPVSTNSPECVLINEADRTMTIAPTRALLNWFVLQKPLLKSFLPRSSSEMLRLSINPQIIDQFVLPKLDMQQAQDLLNRSCEYAALDLTPDGRGCTVTFRIQPKATSPLDTLLRDMSAPQPDLWNAIPENALFSALYTEPGKTNWHDYFSHAITNKLLFIFSDLQPFLGKERLIYLAPTKSKTGIRFVQIAPVVNESAAREAIKKLTTPENKTGLRIKHEQTRKTPDQTFEQYSLTYRPAAQEIADANAPTGSTAISFATVMPLLLRNALLEVTVKDKHLFVVASSASTIEQECPDYPFAPQRLTLKQRIMTFSSSANIIAAGDLRILAFLRQILITLAPADALSQKIFTSITDGFQFWAVREPNNTYALSIRLAGNEIGALQKAFREDREALQDLFFTLFTRQMKPVTEAPQRKP